MNKIFITSSIRIKKYNPAEGSEFYEVSSLDYNELEWNIGSLILFEGVFYLVSSFQHEDTKDGCNIGEVYRGKKLVSSTPKNSEECI